MMIMAVFLYFFLTMIVTNEGAGNLSTLGEVNDLILGLACFLVAVFYFLVCFSGILIHVGRCCCWVSVLAPTSLIFGALLLFLGNISSENNLIPRDGFIERDLSDIICYFVKDDIKQFWDEFVDKYMCSEFCPCA